MSRRKIKTVIAFFLVLTSLICSISTVANAATKYVDVSDYESLAEIYKNYFRLGAACEAIDHWGDQKKEIGNSAKELALSTLFNSITCGNEMKPAYSFNANEEGLFKIDKAATEMMTWAKENGVGMRGHTLVWHSQINPSIFAKDFKAYTTDGILTTSDSATLDENCLVDRETLIERLRIYIRSMIEYTYANGFASTIYAWDVVNEASDEGKSDGMRRSYWYQIIGPEFLYYSFLFAREAIMDFSVQYADLYGLNAETDDLSSIRPWLFYNDYNEWITPRCNYIIKFLTDTPFNADRSLSDCYVINPDGDGTIYGDGLIDGIGMQGHISATNDIESYMTALEKYSDAVGNVQITELDIGVTGNSDNKWLTQAQYAYKFFTRLVEEVEKGYHLTSVTFWGLTDDASWRSENSPLLLRADLSKKPIYEAVAAAGKKQSFDMTLAESIIDLSDVVIDFEPYKQDGETHTIDPKEEGFYSRGSGHQAKLLLKPKVNTTPDAKIGYSMCVTRTEQDATVHLDISKFSGSRICFNANVKCDDTKLSFGAEIPDSIVVASYGEYREKDENGFTFVEIVIDVPVKLQNAFIFIETDGASDIYVDDVSVKVSDKDVTAIGTEIGFENPEAKAEATAAPEVVSSNDTDITDIDVVQNSNAETAGSANANSRKSSVSITAGIILVIIFVAFFVFIKKRSKK